MFNNCRSNKKREITSMSAQVRFKYAYIAILSTFTVQVQEVAGRLVKIHRRAG